MNPVARRHRGLVEAHGHLPVAQHDRSGCVGRGGVQGHRLRVHRSHVAGQVHHARLHGPVARMALVVLGTPLGAAHEGGLPGLAAVGGHLQGLAGRERCAQAARHEAPRAAVVGGVVVGVHAAVLADARDGGGLRGRQGVDLEVPAVARVAGLAHRAGGRGGDVVRTLAQVVFGRERPGAVGAGLGAAQEGGAVVERHGMAGLGRAVQGRPGVVGDLAGGQHVGHAHVVVDVLDHRGRRLAGVDGHLVAPRRRRLVARCVFLHEREGVQARGQWRDDLQRPLAVVADDGFTQRMGAGAVPDHHRDGVAGLAGACAGEQRAGVVGGLAGGHVAGDAACGVEDAGDGQFARVGWRDVDLEIERARRFALVAGGVARHDGDDVVAFIHVGRRREGPLAVVVHDGLADLNAVVPDEDGVARRALALELGLTIVRDAAGGEGAHDVACVVDDAVHGGRLWCEDLCACYLIDARAVVDEDVCLFGCHAVPML
ncbi:hypothetical protein D3C86_1013380 [compost metagenome]